jgi:hypothetical protein
MNPKLTYATQGLSQDCTRVVPGTETPEQPVESADLLGKLQNFAAIPAIDFLDETTNFSLKGRGQEFLVRNESGQLYLVQAPAATHSPVARSPAEIVQFLDDEFSRHQTSEPEPVMVSKGGLRGKLGSLRVLVGLIAGWAVIAYFTFKEAGPEGVVIVEDAARAANFSQQLEGRYGAESPAGASVFEVRTGRVKVYLTSEEGVDREPIMDKAYVIGQREGAVVMVVENGAVLALNETGALVFEDEVYPRLP